MARYTLVQLKEELSSGKINARELIGEYIKRAKQSNLNAYITLNEEEALKEAKRAEQLIKTGKAHPLTGIPMGIKDAISTRGLRTTAGSKILENYIPPFDATVVEKLRNGGAVIVGKNNMDEFAMGSSTETSGYGPTLNPYNKECVPGGSSGGSAAAVAAGLCVASLGSDTGGSIRQPASFCGVVGFKPTYGRVSRYGLIAMASSLDQIGPITNNVADSKIIFKTIAGYDKKDATSLKSLPPAGKAKKRVGIIREHLASNALAPSVKKAVKNKIAEIEKAGFEIVELNIPLVEQSLAIYYIIMPVEVASNLARFDGIKYGVSAKEERTLKQLYTKTRSQFLGNEAQRRIILGSFVSSAGYFDTYYKKAIVAQNNLRQSFKNAFDKVDFIVGPTTPTTAFKLGEKLDPMEMYLNDIFTVPANIAGLPAISLPIGNDEGGLPIGFQVIGAFGEDEKLLDFAQLVEDIQINK